MKPTGRIELAFETGLIFCFGYGIGDAGFLQRVFDFKISWRSPFLVFSGQPDTKRAFHGLLTKFFDVAPYNSIIFYCTGSWIDSLECIC